MPQSSIWRPCLVSQIRLQQEEKDPEHHQAKEREPSLTSQVTAIVGTTHTT